MGKHTITRAIVPSLLAIMGCWVLFVASLTAHELLLGAGFTILTVGVSYLAWKEMHIRFWPTLKQLARTWRLPWYILHDSYEVTSILFFDLIGARHAGSLYRAAPFYPGSDSRRHARAILAVSATSMTPSIIVLGVSHDRIFLHQLEYSPLPRMIKGLEKHKPEEQP